MQSSLFERGCPVLVVVCVARKLRPCPSYSRRRDRIDLGLWRSLYKGGAGYYPFVKRRLLWRIVPFVAARPKEALPCLLSVWHLQWAHSSQGRLRPHQHRQSPYIVSRPLSTRKRQLMIKQPGARKCVAKHVTVDQRVDKYGTYVHCGAVPRGHGHGPRPLPCCFLWASPFPNPLDDG